MTPDFPSDDGGNIIPRYRHNQLDQLARMFGDAEPMPRRKRSPGETVTFQLTWAGQRSRKQLKRLTDEEFATYERSRMDALPYVGDHVRHFERPFEHWTADDLTRLTADMLATLRKCPPPRRPSFDSRIFLHINRFNGYNARNDRLHIHICAGLEYRAEVDIRPVAIPEHAFATFFAAIQPYQFSVSEKPRGVAIAVNEYKSLHWTPGQTDPDALGGITPAGHSGRVPAVEPQDDDDDDLDDIEKAARRALHGQRNIPNTSRQAGGTDVDDYRRLLDIARVLGPAQRRMLRILAEELQKEGQ